jgi:hypothetical protein
VSFISIRTINLNDYYYCMTKKTGMVSSYRAKINGAQSSYLKGIAPHYMVFKRFARS